MVKVDKIIRIVGIILVKGGNSSVTVSGSSFFRVPLGNCATLDCGGIPLGDVLTWISAAVNFLIK